MKTATIIYQPEESDDNDPEYLIPDRIPFEAPDSSEPDFFRPESTPSAGFDDKTPEKISVLAVVPPIIYPLKGKFKLLQLWEGRVVEVRDTEFDAIISDKTNPDFADELVSIDISEVAPDDLSLVDKGAVFYWSVGYLDYPGRGRIRESKLRFRRLRGWTKKEIENAKRTGKEFAEFFESNSVCSA